MFDENIELVDRNNKPVYRKQLSRLGEKGERALQDSPGDFEEEDEHPDLDPADAKIRMQPVVLKEVTEATNEYIRMKSQV
jgi:hypothetical protein